MISQVSQFYNPPKCRPFIKWAGGKWQLLPQISKFIPSYFERYFEPFAGGGAMYFYLSGLGANFSAYLSDLNGELINAYQVLKTSPEKLVAVLRYNEEAYRKGGEEYYYKLRGTNSSNKLEKAARFIALNKTCYNGLYRVNKAGRFNVPFGRYQKPQICDSKNLLNVGKLLRYTNVHLQSCDYKKILRYAKKGDFVYFDPPYNPTEFHNSFTSYTKQRFGERKQRQLAKIFKQLHKRKSFILLSNSDTPLVRELYRDYSIIKIRANRSINSDASKRTNHRELLIGNSI